MTSLQRGAPPHLLSSLDASWVSAPALGQLLGGRVPAEPQTSLNHSQVRALAFARAIHPAVPTCLHLHSALQLCSTPYAQPGLHKLVQGTPQRAWEEVLAKVFNHLISRERGEDRWVLPLPGPRVPIHLPDSNNQLHMLVLRSLSGFLRLKHKLR